MKIFFFLSLFLLFSSPSHADMICGPGEVVATVCGNRLVTDIFINSWQETVPDGTCPKQVFLCSYGRWQNWVPVEDIEGPNMYCRVDQFSFPPTTEPVSCDPEACPAANTPAGQLFTDGMYSQSEMCEMDCAMIPTGQGIQLSMRDDSGVWHTVQDYKYTGGACSAGSGTPSPPPDCENWTKKCTDFCRATPLEVSCTPDGSVCNCPDMPPYPIVDRGDQSPNPQPDQDKDGVGSGNDSDVDGDQTDNGSDSDVDGDGTDNGSDSDVDGDGTGNGGDDDSWTPAAGSPGGTGSDPDVDGDGTGNCTDSDVDGDGIDNGTDPDADGDGIPNGNDLDPLGCDPTDSGSSPGDGVEGTEDGTGTGTGEDTDQDGSEDVYNPDPDNSVDFESLIASTASLKNKFPVSLAKQLFSIYDSLTATPSAIEFTVDMGIGSFDVDLSPFDNIMKLLRSLFSLLMLIGTIILVVRMWSN